MSDMLLPAPKPDFNSDNLIAIELFVWEMAEIDRALALIDEALTFHGIDDWMLVDSVIQTLQTKSGMDQFVESIPPESAFHNNQTRGFELLRILERWRGVHFYRMDTMAEAFNKLLEVNDRNQIMINCL